MDKSFESVRSKLLLTQHGRRNLYGTRKDNVDRTYITLNAIAASISKGILGFSGSKKYKSTYKGIEVIWKYDEGQDLFVVLTYYKKNPSRKGKNKDIFCLA